MQFQRIIQCFPNVSAVFTFGYISESLDFEIRCLPVLRSENAQIDSKA